MGAPNDDYVSVIAEQILSEFTRCGGSPEDFVEHMQKVVAYVKDKYVHPRATISH